MRHILRNRPGVAMLYKWTNRLYISKRASSATWPRAPVTLRNQQLTHAWWNTRRRDYALYTSKLVTDEAADGDPATAALRLAVLRPIVRLEVDGTGAVELAKELRAYVPLPAKAHADALHIAVAAVSGMAYLLTWNCKHIANPRLYARIEKVCELWRIGVPVLCTPRDLQGG